MNIIYRRGSCASLPPYSELKRTTQLGVFTSTV